MAALFGRFKDKTRNKRSKTKNEGVRTEAAKPVTAAPSVPAPRGPLAKEGAGKAYRILISPLFTEKASRQQSLGQYAFIVAKDANKVEVAAAVRDLYGVKPLRVRIVSLRGKRVRTGRVAGKRKDEKKAVVVLRPGESITIAEA